MKFYLPKYDFYYKIPLYRNVRDIKYTLLCKGKVSEMSVISSTQYFKTVEEVKVEVSDVLKTVYEALVEKGYNPVNQIVGYIMSGDPTYVTSYKNARSLIMKIERDELVEELFKEYK